MEGMRDMRLAALKARIGNRDYVVDDRAVADAIVRRLLAARRELQRAARALNGGSDPRRAGA
jgi:hypothetical protein